MKDHERIEQEIERTLTCFGKADRVECGPWFHARLMARMRASELRERALAWLPGPGMLKSVLVIAIVIVNACAVALALRGGAPDAGNRETMLAMLFERYSIDRDAYGFFRIGNEVRR